jgi:hypothetical protein
VIYSIDLTYSVAVGLYYMVMVEAGFMAPPEIAGMAQDQQPEIHASQPQEAASSLDTRRWWNPSRWMGRGRTGLPQMESSLQNNVPEIHVAGNHVATQSSHENRLDMSQSAIFARADAAKRAAAEADDLEKVRQQLENAATRGRGIDRFMGMIAEDVTAQARKKRVKGNLVVEGT